jgi:hypothetical protein
MSDLVKVISIELDDKTKTGLENIDQTFKDVDDSIKNASTTTTNLRQELKQLQRDLLSGKFTGEEFTQATQRAGELKDTIGDLNARINTLSSDTQNLDTLVAAAQGLAAGFSVVQGAAGLLGDENEELQQTILKVQSATAILNGLTEIQNMLQKESKVAIALTTAAQKIDTFIKYGSVTATEAQTAATVQATVATKALRTALIATGIGAIVVLVVSLVAAWNDYNDSVKAAEKAKEDFNDEMERSKELLNDELGALEYNTQVAILLAKKRGASEEELRAIEKKGYEERIKEIDRLLYSGKLSADETKKLGDEKLALYRSNTLKELQIDVDKEDKKRAIAKKGQEDRDAADKTKEAKRVKDFEKEKADTIANGEAIQSSINAINKKREDKELEAKQKAIDLLKSIEEANKPPETPIQKLEREYKENLAIVEAGHQSTLMLTADFIKKRKELQDASRAADIDADEYEKNRKIQVFQDTTDAVGSIAQSGEDLLAAVQATGIARGKAGQATMKALALVQIGADSAIAFSKMMQGTEASAAGAASVAGPAAPGVYLATKIAFYASGTATILANIARAKKLLSSGGNSSGAGGAGGGAGAAPAPQAQFNIVGQSSTNQLAQTIATQQNQPVQAFVVGNDVTTQQALDRNKITNSTFL